MAFVRKKRVGPYEYYQLVENRWMEGQPRQRVLVHLGRYLPLKLLYSSGRKPSDVYVALPRSGGRKPTSFRRIRPPQRPGCRPS
jgi:hypothetical protein